MATVSLCMIVKNEEKNLPVCLKSVEGIIDEIIIVDTGSTDDTLRVARDFTDSVYEFEWIDDFSAARNYAFSKARMDYIMWLDADDVVMERDREQVQALIKALDCSIDAVMMRYNVGFDSSGRTTFSYYRERIVRRNAGFMWCEPVHEYLCTAGNVITSEAAITHTKQHTGELSDRNIRIYENRIKTCLQLSPRSQYYYARELMEHGRYQDALTWFETFLSGGYGWVEDNIQSCLELGRCHLEMGNDKMALGSLVRSFTYATPRAEACCRLGYLFKARGDYRQALFWFSLALTLEKPGGWGFINDDEWGYVPAIESAVCYYALGELKKACDANELASSFNPASEAVEYNRKLFKQEGAEAQKKVP